MMLTLMGGSMFGLHSFHASNLTLVDQFRELGASKDLLQCVFRLEKPARRDRAPSAMQPGGHGPRDPAGAPGSTSQGAEEEHDAGKPGRRRPR